MNRVLFTNYSHHTARFLRLLLKKGDYMKIKTFSALITSLVAVFFFYGCGSSAHIEKDNSVQLSNYKTYTWLPRNDSAKVGVVNSIAEQNIRNSTDEQLQKNGFRKVKSNPDLLVSYDVLVDKRTLNQSDPIYSQPYTRLFYNPRSGRYSTIYFPSQFMGYQNSSSQVKEGTVTISMIDAKTDKTIWQGWASDQLNNNFITSREAERNVRSIFKKFNVSQ